MKLKNHKKGAIILIASFLHPAGCQTIPAVLTDDEPAEISIIENLTAIEEADAIEKLRALHDYALSDLTTVLGKSASTISEILSLNKAESLCGMKAIDE